MNEQEIMEQISLMFKGHIPVELNIYNVFEDTTAVEPTIVGVNVYLELRTIEHYDKYYREKRG